MSASDDLYTLAPALKEQAEAVFAMHEALFRGHVEEIWGWHPVWQDETFASNWRECETRVVLDEHEELAGYVQTIVREDHLLVKNLGLLPAHQGRGLGAEIVESLKSEAVALRVPLRLSVFTTNDRALRFYEREGFVPHSSSREFWHLIWMPTAVENE